MAKDLIYVETQTKETYKQSTTRITAIQWKVYYYMLSVSKFDSQKVASRRYIDKNYFNIAQACRDLSIKSIQTFYNAIKRLEERHLIHNTENYYFLYAKNWIEVDRHILSTLLRYAKQREKDIDLLRVFLILKKMDKIAENSPERDFTLRQLCILLGHGGSTPEYYSNVRIYLALLSFWGLIELKQYKQLNTNFGAGHIIYHLQKIKETDLNSDFESDVEEERNTAILSTRLMDKLKFSCSEILEE